MKAEIIYLTPASEDFMEIVKMHLNRSGPKYAREIRDVMEASINKLEDFPLLGQIHPDPMMAALGFRKLVLNDTYVAVYKNIDGKVYIYGIVDGRTDYPGLFR